MKYKPTNHKLFRDESGTYHLTDKNQVKRGLPKKVYDKCLELKMVKAIKVIKEVSDGREESTQ
jgi:hypothetical protein